MAKKSGKKTKRGRPRDLSLVQRRRDEILKVATTVFSRRGYRNTDVQEIADRVGVGKGTIYRYYASKEDLFLATVDAGIQGLKDAIRKEEAMSDDPVERMRIAIKAYLRYFESSPDLAELFIQERAEFKNRKQSLYFEHHDEEDRWRTELEALIEVGRLRDIQPDAILDVVGDLLYGSMITNLISGRRKPLDLHVKDIVEILFFGILGPHEKRRFRRAQTS